MADENKANEEQNDEQQSDQLFNNVKIRSITTEIEDSYLDYAMSVIVSRALPDVRD